MWRRIISLKKLELGSPRFTITTITTVIMSHPLMLAFRRMNLKKLKEATSNPVKMKYSPWKETLLTLLGM